MITNGEMRVPGPTMMYVIIACHNRKLLTTKSIELAQAAADHAGLGITFTVYDDGSTDGTSDALASMPQSIKVLQGTGDAFWAKSMAVAEACVLNDDRARDSDLIVWLNDDVMLDRDAFVSMVAALESSSYRSIVAGAMRDPNSGNCTYSGMRRSGTHPLSFSAIPPSDQVQDIDTFNGNLLTVPIGVARFLGGMDGGFSHALADIDYGLRAGRAGVTMLLAPGTQGTCPRNPTPGRKRAGEDWRSFIGPKGAGNFRSLQRILSRSNPSTWPLIIGVSYTLWWARRLKPERNEYSPARRGSAKIATEQQGVE